MKGILVLLLAFVIQFLAVHSQLCGTGANEVTCTCDPSKYIASANPPNPTVQCDNGVMTINISKCQLEKSKFDSSTLALIDSSDPECQSKAYLGNGDVQMVFQDKLSIKKCGNSVYTNATHIIYTNILHIYPATTGPIITRSNFTASLSCAYPLNYTAILNSTIKPNTSIVELSVPGSSATLNVTMVAYTDSTFTTPVTADTVLYIASPVYISVWIPNLQADTFSIKVLRIYAGGDGSYNGPEYNLTNDNGCPDLTYGDLISVIQNGNATEARFAMNVFQITGYAGVNLFADVTICQDTCISQCSSKSGKSGVDSANGNVATLQMSLNADGIPYSGANERFSMPWTLLLLISSLLFAKLI